MPTEQVENIISPIAPLDPRPDVLAENLETSDVKAEPEETGNHKSLRVFAKPDPDAEYVQFAICQKGSSQNCNPSIGKPLSFAAHMHTFPDPPEGEIEIYIRSCVAPNRAVNFQRPCGNWVVEPYFQSKNHDQKLRKLLIDNYISTQRILDECYKIQRVLQDYYINNEKSDSQFDTLVENYLNHIPPEICKTLMLSQEWQVLEQQIATENSKRSSEEKESKGASVLLSLGVPAFIFGIVSQTAGIVYNNRFDENIAKHWTQLLGKYAGDKPNYRSYDSVDEIELRIKEVNAYIAAIESKPPSQTEAFANQKKVLLEEKKFLEAYEQFAKDPNTQRLFKNRDHYLQPGLETGPNNLNRRIEDLTKIDPELDNEFVQRVRQAEINKIASIDTSLTRTNRFNQIKPAEITVPPLKSGATGLSYKLKYAGILGTAIGAILIGAEIFGLEASTISDINETKAKLDLIYEEINTIRTNIKANQELIDSLIQG